MGQRFRVCCCFAFFLALSGTAAGQDVATTEWVYLRRSPSMSGAKLRELPPNDTLTLRDVPSRNSFVAVRTADGKAGWVGGLFLRDLHAIAPAASVSIQTAPNGQPFSEIVLGWEKPPLERADIRVKGGSEVCPPEGDGTDDGTNTHKNRADVPTKSFLVTLDAIRALPDTALWRHTDRSWDSADSALVLPYDGIPVTVEGYFEIVKPQSSSPPTANKRVGESPNCHSWAEADTDWHMALVADPSETEDKAVVVEPTPRTKRRNAGWAPAAAMGLAVRRSAGSPRNENGAPRVRVTGFLMLDPVHPTHIKGGCAIYPNCHATKFFRATLWEVHPVTRIEVFQNNVWVDMNNIAPPL